MKRYDVVVIGGGPGGLAAAKGAREQGAEQVLVLEREFHSGGILNQCIHDGFGLIHYHAMLTGPEYALRARQEALDAGAELLTGAMVTQLTPDHILTAVSRAGLAQYKAGAVVLATGCRERTRGALAIPGSRPAGIYTAGTAQNLVNVRDLMIGRHVVILGSGDIGLIMARRLTLEGAEILCVAEARSAPGGLERNVSQCLYDFHIPLLLRCTVTQIFGKKRLTGVELSTVDEAGRPIPGTQRTVACDTLLLSVGLIPENEIAQMAGVRLDPNTNGAVTDAFLQTSVPGIFSCGNSRRVMDLADFVTVQSLTAGRNAAAFVRKCPFTPMPPETSNTMAKGLPEKNCITCILCPKGCRVRTAPDDTTTGNLCPKGKEYALQEQWAPKRVLTTTLRCADGSLLPVKSSDPLPRESLLASIRCLKGVVLSQEKITCGDIVLTDPFHLGIHMLSASEHVVSR